MSTEQKTHVGAVNVDGDHCEKSDCWCWNDRYMVVTRHSAEALASAVNAFIHQKGWAPAGGVNRSVQGDTALWAQAMERHIRG